MGRAPFEVPGPLPIGRERPYQTEPGAPRRRGANNGLPRLLSVNPEPGPASPGPAPTPPPSSKCLHLHQSGRAGPEGREGMGDGRGGDGRAGLPSSPRHAPRRGVARLPAKLPSSRARGPPLSLEAQPGPRRCASLESHRGSHLRPSRRPSLASDHRAQPRLRARPVPSPGRAGLRSSEGPARRRARSRPDTSLGPRRFR